MESGVEFLQSLALLINDAADGSQLLELIIDKSIEFTGATSGSLVSLNPGGYLEVEVVRGFTENVKKDMRLPVGEGITGWVAENNQPYLCPDTEKDENYRRIKGNIRSEIAVPMRERGEVIGVINLDSRRKNTFTKEQLEILMVLGSYATLVYKQLGNISRLQLRIAYQELLLSVTEVLNNVGSLSERFRRIMELLQEQLHLERGTIVLRCNEENEYCIYTAAGLTDDEIGKGVYKPGEGITGKIIESGEALAVKNIFDNDAFLDRTRARRRARKQHREISFIGVPICILEDVVGVLSVDKPYEGEKFDEDISMLKILASFLAHALQVDELSRQETERLLEENTKLKETVQAHYSFDRMVGVSPAMLEIYRKIELVANSEATVLVAGESGTGKELVADAIIKRSRRAEQAVIKLNCSAIPDTLLESELFGYKKGAFTGAGTDKKGRILAADGGTLFLDEIGDMPIPMQTKLLRVLQNREVDVIGSNAPVPVDVRIIAATSRNLETMLEDGSFREDLYYRLNVFRLDLPPLRERREDIEMIARHYLKELAEREGVPYAGISLEALQRIARLPLEGNVRELQNKLEQAFLIAGKQRIEEFHLNLGPAGEEEVEKSSEENEGFYVDALPPDLEMQRGHIYRNIVGEVEKKLIHWALEKTGDNRSEAARLLGINRNTLNSKLKE